MADEDENTTTADVDDDAATEADTTTAEPTADEDHDGAGGAGDRDRDGDKQVTDVGDQPTTTGVDWKAMARKWEKRAKENASAKKRLDEATSADKTELDTLRESIAALQQENETNKLRALRADVASKTGVPVELLSATTEEDLAEQAEAILEFVKAKTEVTATKPRPRTTAPANGHKPKEKLRSGAESSKPELSREDVLAAVLGKGRKRNNSR